MTTKATPYREELTHLVYLFLVEIGQVKIAQKLSSTYSLPEWIQNDNYLFKKGLTKIIKQYIRKNQNINNYFLTRLPQVSESQQSQSETKNQKKNKKIQKKTQETPQPKQQAKGSNGWKSTFAPPKLLHQILGEEKPNPNIKQKIKDVQQTINSRKKNKKSKVQSEQDQDQEQLEEESSSEDEEEQIQIKPKKKMKTDEKIQIVSSKKNVNNTKQMQKEQVQTFKPNAKILNGHKISFSRINVEEVMQKNSHLFKDNSFQSKNVNGAGGDEWGQFGYDKLKHTRGEAFKKTKGKLKNNAFQNTGIDVNRINSFKIE